MPSQGFPGSAVVKNPPANAGVTEDASSIPGSGRSLKEETATHSSIRAWEIPRTGSHDGLQSWGHAESDTIEQMSVRARVRTHTHTHTHTHTPPQGSHCVPDTLKLAGS